MSWESTGSTFAINHVSQPSILGSFDNFHLFIENVVAYNE